mmetsp:Transcript_100174/g.282655  ORF Transcript_100174/g.282655 Transcript_100174/m.282655 type:complete len:241 (-) Transcript_100174:1407-2129(-)
MAIISAASPILALPASKGAEASLRSSAPWRRCAWSPLKIPCNSTTFVVPMNSQHNCNTRVILWTIFHGRSSTRPATVLSEPSDKLLRESPPRKSREPFRAGPSPLLSSKSWSALGVVVALGVVGDRLCSISLRTNRTAPFARCSFLATSSRVNTLKSFLMLRNSTPSRSKACSPGRGPNSVWAKRSPARSASDNSSQLVRWRRLSTEVFGGLPQEALYSLRVDFNKLPHATNSLRKVLRS